MSRRHWGFGNVYLRGRIWWYYFPANGRTVHESSRSTSKAEAQGRLKARLAEVQRKDFAGVGPERTTVSALLDNLLRDYRINGKSIDWATIVVEKHLRPFFQYHKADKVGTDLIAKYVDQRRAKGRANGTINRELAVLRRSFRLGYEAEPPTVRRVPKIPEFDERASIRQGFFEHDEFVRLREVIDPTVRPILVFAYYTGCRKGEILSLKWSQVDLGAGMVRLNNDTKSKEARSIPLVLDLAVLMRDMKAERDALWPACQWVFSRAGQRILDFKGAWAAACKTAVVDRLFHDLRRTGVRNLIRAGVPEKVARMISGHKTRDVFERYQIVDEGDFQQAAVKLEAFLKSR